ncbi:dihydrofolate reductase family protein [Tenggerimyces flavus]|uniref:Dihydrofolate reductase family protein n=1 Tax=Tenggerimyces flavus TaxID=1708749 RepID=A0ABV7Y5R4_9ACTN|nr:dihydrofolate reductase family protein [Tenggerimyces flavus]MBM7788384.1 dihydrofolate reductase [Tenggerimyces flavus]
MSRRIVVVNFQSLDGVIQSVLFPDEDTEGGFDRGGWVPPYVDETVARVMKEATTKAGGMLLGRKTYEAFASIWPHQSEDDPAVAAMNRMPKYVASTTLREGTWAHTVILDDVPEAVAKLKHEDGADLVVFGSGQLLQTLREHDLVDEYQLLTFPIVLGKGKRMFPDGAQAKLGLVDVVTAGSGVVIATYRPTR